MSETHIGRAFGGPDPDHFDCDCPRAACGLTNPDQWLTDCPFHNFTKTIRQSHPAIVCPATIPLARAPQPPQAAL